MMTHIEMIVHQNNLKKRGFFSTELTICIVVALILMFITFLAYPEYKNNANRTTAQQDLRMLKSAVVSYAGLANDSKPPANLGQLLANPSLTADEAIDGVEHGAFLDKKKGWTTDSSSIKDPWGEAYQYTYDAATGTGTISTNGGGKSMSIPF